MPRQNGFVKVLFVNHTGTVGGAEHSLVTLLAHLPPCVSATAASPAGPLHDALRDRGVPVVEIRGTEGSLRIHPLLTPKSLADMAATGAQVTRIVRRLQIDLVHANSLRSGLFLALFPRSRRLPVVTHVRDVLPRTAASRLSVRAVASRSSLLLANSDYTARALRRDRVTPSIRVVWNPVDLTRFDPRRLSRAEARGRLSLSSDDLVLAVVAQITPWKGQDDAVRALALVRRQHPRALLLLVGSAKFAARSTRYDNVGFLASLEQIAQSLGLSGAVRFLGERQDVPEILRAVDVLLLPSWEEPFGRSVIEGMAMGLPVLATEVGGPAEIIREGVDGMLLPPRNPGRWAAAVSTLLGDPELRRRLGAEAQHSARRRFGIDSHVERVVSAYRSVLPAS